LKKLNKAKHKAKGQGAVQEAVEKLGLATNVPLVAVPEITDGQFEEVSAAEPPVPKAIQQWAKEQAALMGEAEIPPEPTVKDDCTIHIDGLQLKLGEIPVARITAALYDGFAAHADTSIKPLREGAGMVYIRMVEIRNLIGMKIRTAINQGAYWRSKPNVLIAKHEDGTYTMLTTDDL
jgi:hypothetical protein